GVGSGVRCGVFGSWKASRVRVDVGARVQDKKTGASAPVWRVGVCPRRCLRVGPSGERGSQPWTTVGCTLWRAWVVPSSERGSQPSTSVGGTRRRPWVAPSVYDDGRQSSAVTIHAVNEYHSWHE